LNCEVFYLLTAIHQQVVGKLKFPAIGIKPQQVIGVFEGPIRSIHEVAGLSIEVRGHRSTRAFAYIVLEHAEDLILGGQWWLNSECVMIDEKASQIRFQALGIVVNASRIGNQGGQQSAHGNQEVTFHFYDLCCEVSVTFDRTTHAYSCQV